MKDKRLMQQFNERPSEAIRGPLKAIWDFEPNKKHPDPWNLGPDILIVFCFPRLWITNQLLCQ
jgi:hypothetical protein